jgi:pimeloyl-ACP methyl ester carboxylesterase
MNAAPTSTPIHVHERGAADDPLAVLIHSTGINGAEMVDRFGLAVPGYHVLAPDRTNYGESRRSSPGGCGRSNGHVPEVAMIEDDAAEIATILGRGAHLVGYSYGGIVALTIAARRPRLVRSLILLEPPAFQLLPHDPDAVSTSTRISSAIDTVYDDPSAYFAAYMSSAFGDTFRVPLEFIPTERKVASMREQVAWDPELNLDAIADAHIPTLVVCGDWDPGFVAVSRHLATALSGHVIEYAESSHFFDERWNDIADELARFWRAVDEQ